MSWLIDTNILVRLRDTDSQHHLACIRAVERLRERRESLCICTQVAIEFFVVTTRPRDVNGIGMTCEEALQDLRDMRGLFVWLSEPSNIDWMWERLIEKYRVTGKAAHDVRLLALMVSHGVGNLLTLNVSHFKRFAEIEAVSPYEVGG